MAWKKSDINKWALEHNIDVHEIDKKLKLRDIIVRLREKKGLMQAELAEQVGVSRSRIAQIENGVKLHKMSFDVLLRVVAGLGYTYNIVTKKEAA